MTSTAESRPTVGAIGGRRGKLLLAAVLLGIGLVAFLIRLAIMLRGGGLHGYGLYDDGVYYASADALAHGRLPYRDFLFIQPPLIAVVTAPIAFVGSLVSDPFGYALARLAYMALGGFNAALVAWNLRRFGWVATVVGGLFYAVLWPAVYGERSVLLEPLGTVGLLLALLFLQRAAARPGLAVAAGIVGGLAVGAKIWYIVPVLVILVFASGRRLRFLIGVAIGGLAIYLPFLLAAPQQMVQQVAFDQLGRPRSPGILRRFEQIVGARTTVGIDVSILGPILVLLAAAAVACALITRGARVYGVLAITAAAVLIASPSWFGHYTMLTAPFLALCVGIGAQRLAMLFDARGLRVAVAVLIVAGAVGANEANDRSAVGTKTPNGASNAAAVVHGCVTSDDPAILIEMNVLSRDLSMPDCEVWPDVTGWTYDRDSEVMADGRAVSRPENAKWQRDVVRFLESGDATIHTRALTGLSRASIERLESGEVLFRDRSWVVYATTR